MDGDIVDLIMKAVYAYKAIAALAILSVVFLVCDLSLSGFRRLRRGK